MEEMVNNSAPANVFAFAPEGTEAVVDTPAEEVKEEVAEADSKEESVSEEEKGKAEESAEGVADLPKDNQKDIGQAFQKESKRLERKYQKQLESDPMRQIGKLMVDELMDSEGISQEEAIKKVNENFLNAVAKKNNITPNVAKRLYQQPQPQSEESEIDRIVQAVQEAEKPEGFNEAEAYADESFLNMLRMYPAEAAIRIYAAEKSAQNAKQDLAEKLRARASIPQSIKPQQTATPKTDWTTVSKADFLAEKARRAKLH